MAEKDARAVVNAKEIKKSNINDSQLKEILFQQYPKIKKIRLCNYVYYLGNNCSITPIGVNIQISLAS